MKRFVYAIAVWFLLLTSGYGADAFKPIVPASGYDHDRWKTLPRGHVNDFRAYTSSFDNSDDDDGDGTPDHLGVPEWVSYQLNKGSATGPQSKPNKWLPVLNLPSSIPSPTDDSYRNSGFSRGHMCMRSHAHRLGTNANHNTYTVSNGCPQKQAFNAGHWLGLEILTGKWANTYGKIWIICGPVFKNRKPTKTIGDGSEVKIGVPHFFYKIVIRESTNSNRPLVMAFLYKHDPSLNDKSENVDHSEFLTSVDKIETLTGLDFLTSLPKPDQDAVESDPAAELWPLTLPSTSAKLAAKSSRLLAARRSSAPEYINGKVTGLSDGDTIRVKSGNTTFKIRLHGVDCPESDQRFGPKAKAFTRNLVNGQIVTVKVKEKDRYGRYVGEVFVDGKSLNRELARNGLAWWYRDYAKNDLDIKRLEAGAKSRRTGLWSQSNPIAPWDWRRQR